MLLASRNLRIDVGGLFFNTFVKRDSGFSSCVHDLRASDASLQRDDVNQLLTMARDSNLCDARLVKNDNVFICALQRNSFDFLNKYRMARFSSSNEKTVPVPAYACQPTCSYCTALAHSLSTLGDEVLWKKTPHFTPQPKIVEQ